MKKIFTVVILITAEFITVSAQAQQLARIANGDSYLNIREQQSSDSRITGTFKAGEFFYVISSDENWWEAQSLSGKTGFVFHSRVEVIDSMPEADRRNLFSNVFENEKEIGGNYSVAFSKFNPVKKKWNSKTDSLNFKKAKSFLDKYSNEKYLPLTSEFAEYFCSTHDSVLIKNFLMTLCIPFVSEKEISLERLAECYQCDSAMIDKILSEFSVENQKKISALLESIHQNIYPEDLDSIKTGR